MLNAYHSVVDNSLFFSFFPVIYLSEQNTKYVFTIYTTVRSWDFNLWSLNGRFFLFSHLILFLILYVSAFYWLPVPLSLSHTQSHSDALYCISMAFCLNFLFLSHFIQSLLSFVSLWLSDSLVIMLLCVSDSLYILCFVSRRLSVSFYYSLPVSDSLSLLCFFFLTLLMILCLSLTLSLSYALVSFWLSVCLWYSVCLWKSYVLSLINSLSLNVYGTLELFKL